MQISFKNEALQRSFFGFGLLLWIKINLQDVAEGTNNISSAFLLPNGIVFWHKSNHRSRLAFQHFFYSLHLLL